MRDLLLAASLGQNGLMRHSCALLQDTLARHVCQTLLGVFLCGTIEQDFAVTQCDTLLSKTIVRHPYGADTLLKAARS